MFTAAFLKARYTMLISLFRHYERWGSYICCFANRMVFFVCTIGPICVLFWMCVFFVCVSKHVNTQRNNILQWISQTDFSDSFDDSGFVSKYVRLHVNKNDCSQCIAEGKPVLWPTTWNASQRVIFIFSHFIHGNICMYGK